MAYVPFAVWHSVERFFETPHDRPPKYAFMITVYLDESRQEDRNSYMVLAGFWGKKEQWDALVPDWIVGLGKRKSLHMNTLRLNSRTGAKRAEKILGILGSLPRKHGLTPIYGAVKTGDYLDIVASTPQERKWSGYAVCLTAVIQKLSVTVPSNESIKIVCEDQLKYEDLARRAFGQVRIAVSRPERAYFSGIEFIAKNSSVLTQPSDFLAFAVAHYHENRRSHKSILCKSILGPEPETYGLTLRRDRIRTILSKWKAIKGPQWDKP